VGRIYSETSQNCVGSGPSSGFSLSRPRCAPTAARQHRAPLRRTSRRDRWRPRTRRGRHGLQVPNDDAQLHAGRRPLAAGGAASRRPDEWALATSASSISTISRNSLDNWLDGLSQNMSARAVIVYSVCLVGTLKRAQIFPRCSVFSDQRMVRAL
jgi:hypothetical protein